MYLLLLFTVYFSLPLIQTTPGVPVVNLDAEELTVIGAFLVAVFFAYFPGVRVKFAGLASKTKSLVMIGLLLGLTGAVTGLDCAGLLNLQDVSCDKAGLVKMAWVFLEALAVNQGTHRIFPEAEDVAQAKRDRDIDRAMIMEA